MYCPKCATQNLEEARYCRSCGVNLSLVPQALSGQLPETPSSPHDVWKHRKSEPSMAEGIQKLFMGVGFLLVAIVLGIIGRGRGWWYWLLIPAFGLLGKGVADVTVAKQRLSNPPQPQVEPSHDTNSVRAADTGELLPPTSVTEGTTKLFDEAQQSR
jgi:hypothetical protein